jgi:hypothetical protein
MQVGVAHKLVDYAPQWKAVGASPGLDAKLSSLGHEGAALVA